MFRWLSVLCLSLIVQPAPAQEADTDPAAPPDRRVLVISIDGLRPDLLLLADCPHIRGLIERGSYTFWAQTTPMGNTLPSHTSMMTGRDIIHHGIYWNTSDIPEGVEYTYPQAPTLFALAHDRGYSTALIAGKSKFRTFARPGTVDALWAPDDADDTDDGDEVTCRHALELIASDAPQVMLLHLGDVDNVGHRDGWGSPEQLRAIERADTCVGHVIDALQTSGLLEQTLVILTSDHGGWRKVHNGFDPRGLHIPWIITGPGVRPGYDLTLEKDLTIHTEDTFATACQFLEIELPDACQGKPITAAFE